MLQDMTNLYSLSKTLQFSLLPMGETERFFMERIYAEDLQRDSDYPKMKEIMDRYHKSFIEKALTSLSPEDFDIKEYYDLYAKKSKTDDDKKKMEKLESAFRKTIANSFSNREEYSSLIKPGDLIKSLLPNFVNEEEEKIRKRFADFSTYFSGYRENRENMYTDEAKSTGIAYRCINENLPRYIDNLIVFQNKVQQLLPQENIDTLNNDLAGFGDFRVEDHFLVDYFAYVLSQSGIDDYNRVLGGYTTEDGRKVKGLNEYINLHNQSLKDLSKDEQRAYRIPRLKPLYKQILSDRESVSFIPESFENQQEVLNTVNTLYTYQTEEVLDLHQTCEIVKNLIANMGEYNLDGIFFSSGAALSNLSQHVYFDWDYIHSAWNEKYNRENKYVKHSESYDEKREKAFKSIQRFTINELLKVLPNSKIINYFSAEAECLTKDVNSKYEEARVLLTSDYKEKRKLQYNDQAISLVKNFLDSVKNLETFLKPFVATRSDGEIDDNFYSVFDAAFSRIKMVDKVYDQTRNFVTAKPYSKNKIKLNFQNPQFLGGWSQSKENDYLGVILRKDEDYYLAVMDKNTGKKSFENMEEPLSNEECYEKLNYKLLPGANKMLPKVFFSKKNAKAYAPSDEILSIRQKESFKKGKTFNLQDCHKLIDFFKDSISKHPDWKNFGFQFSPTESYNDISGFYHEVESQGFKMDFSKVPVRYVNALVESGKLYLYKFYCKDFSRYSKGTPNLHTLYFREMFSDYNLKNFILRLNGEAEMFYRLPSINDDEKIVHKAHQCIDNKNELNPKTKSEFSFDIIKDRRYTKAQYSLHLPMTLNFHSAGVSNVNLMVRKKIRETGMPYIIGIDRGERNLLYVCVLNPAGEIVEQRSLNIIDSFYESQSQKVLVRTDYQSMLTKREKEMKSARQNWTGIETIKELKEGYISQVIHEICDMVIKYDAVVSMEELNEGFKNGRKKVERQVYNKFETMLYTKLRYLVDKHTDSQNPGGVMNAYQLTNPEHKSPKQDGIIFYIPAWLTSKIDPTTGFVNLLYPKYENESASREFFGKFTDITYLENEDCFIFDVDYSKFERTDSDYQKKWQIYSNGDRINTYRNKEKNNEWDSERVYPTAMLKKLFVNNGVDYHRNLFKQILEFSRPGSKDFYQSLIRILRLILQMRNSIPNSTKPEDDFLISPVKNRTGTFYDSRAVDTLLPQDADANGAFHIAKKARWAIQQIINASEEEYPKVNISINKTDWLKYVQSPSNE